MPLETDRRSWLAPKYIEDIEFAHQVRMVTALTFLPHERIKTAAAQLKEYIKEEAVDFISYVEKNFIGSFQTEKLPGSGLHGLACV